MEFETRKLYFSLLSQFAATNGVDIILPQTDTSLETEENDSTLIPQAYENNEIFYMCKITSVAPITFGIRHGASQYKWLVRTHIYTKKGIGDSLSMYHADLIKETFKFGDRKVSESNKYKYKQESQVRISSPIAVSNFVALPTVFTVATVK